jgi:hypothetical protein
LEVTVPVGNLKQQAYRSPHAPIGGASDCFIDGDLIRFFFFFPLSRFASIPTSFTRA